VTADSFAKVLLAAATLLAVHPSIASAQDLRCERGDIELRGLEIVGNQSFTAAELSNVIVTTPSGWARRYFNIPFSPKRCLNRTAFADDRLRLMLYYRRRGFPKVRVDTATMLDGAGGATVRFSITEGPPTQLTSLTITGLDGVRQRAGVLRNLPIASGDRFDRAKIDMAVDSMTRRLRDAGYPGAHVLNAYGTGPRDGTDTSQTVAYDSLTVVTGAFTRIGAVEVSVEPAPKKTQQISDAAVRRLVGIDSGHIYRDRLIVDAQRDLYETDAFAHVAMTLDSAHATSIGTDSVVEPLHVALVENLMHAAQAGLGYGTLDCFRATAELADYNFLGDARRLEMQGRISKIGIGKPLDGASGLCPQARSDPYSTRLNYYLGSTLRQPILLGLRSVPSITAYTSRVSEYNAYVRTTIVGGIASETWTPTRRSTLQLSYTLDYGRTEAQPALFCAVFNLCTISDQQRVQRNQRLGVLSAVFSRDWSDNAVMPTRGGILRLEGRHSSSWVLSDSGLHFNTLLGDISRYISVGGGTVLALRIRGGSVFGSGFIPPQERMYAGGPTTVRGYPQNELGAVTYIAAAYDTVKTESNPVTHDSVTTYQVRNGAYRRAVPVGGNSLLVMNAELRFRSPFLPDLLQFGVFGDAGDVWDRGASAFENFHLKFTPGIQVAALTPVGPARIILGYNPYQRPAGPIYYENSAAAGGQLVCVSPNNNLAINASGQQAEGACTSFTPTQSKSFRSRLTLSLAIGQAF
jgi:outer membrane protein insertion porin family/translocation and assembly module TamA